VRAPASPAQPISGGSSKGAVKAPFDDLRGAAVGLRRAAMGLRGAAVPGWARSGTSAVVGPPLGVGARGAALLGLLRADGGDPLGHGHFEPFGRALRVVEP